MLIVYMVCYLQVQCILIVYMGAIYMYVNCVYWCYKHVYCLHIWLLNTSILIVHMVARYMNIGCVYGC